MLVRPAFLPSTAEGEAFVWLTRVWLSFLLSRAEGEAYVEAALGHGNSGVDMLWLEMMKDHTHAPRAVRAAAMSGLPVFLGISARTDPASGDAILFGNGDDVVPLTVEWFQEMVDILGPSLPVGSSQQHASPTAANQKPLGPSLPARSFLAALQ